MPSLLNFPSSDEEWAESFRKHENLAEAKSIQPLLSVDEYKFDYKVYLSHITLAQGLAAYLTIPTVIGIIRKQFPKPFLTRLVAINSLFYLDALISRYVKKELEENKKPVSDSLVYSAYMGTGISLYSLLFWTGLNCIRNPPKEFANEIVEFAAKGARRRFMGVLHMSIATIFVGTLVSALEAGKVLNNWPWYGND